MKQMKKTAIAVTGVAILSFGLAGCAAGPSGPVIDERTVGTALGALAGGAVGSQFGKGRGNKLATVAGAIVGAALGSQLAQTWTQQDDWYAQQNTQQVLETAPVGQQQQWTNQQSGNGGSVYATTPVYETAVSGYCRDYTLEIYIPGEGRVPVQKTACRGADGVWRDVA